MLTSQIAALRQADDPRAEHGRRGARARRRHRRRAGSRPCSAFRSSRRSRSRDAGCRSCARRCRARPVPRSTPGRSPTRRAGPTSWPGGSAASAAARRSRFQEWLGRAVRRAADGPADPRRRALRRVPVRRRLRRADARRAARERPLRALHQPGGDRAGDRFIPWRVACATSSSASTASSRWG